MNKKLTLEHAHPLWKAMDELRGRGRGSLALPIVIATEWDGVLKPMSNDRQESQIDLPVLDAIEKFVQTPWDFARFAIVTGRHPREIKPHLPENLQVDIMGCSGFVQWRYGARSFSDIPLPRAEMQAALNTAEMLCWRSLVGKIPDPHKAIEFGHHGRLAIHWRGRTEAVQQVIRQVATDVFSSDAMLNNGLRCVPFDGGMELRASSVTKAQIVDLFLRQWSELYDYTPVYFGCGHFEDEHVFEWVNEKKGLSIRVGNSSEKTVAKVSLTLDEVAPALYTFAER